MEEINNKPKHREYIPIIKKFAKKNRENATDAEAKMWYRLNNCESHKFRRQFPIDNKYIADFVCLKEKLIIELDGGQHDESTKDIERTAYLEEQGFKVIRFWDNEVLTNMDACLQVVYEKLKHDN